MSRASDDANLSAKKTSSSVHILSEQTEHLKQEIQTVLGRVLA
jgi:methyl-accepting chemotaxis protein